MTKILFFGSSYHSLSVLQALYRTNPYKIVGIVSQPNRLVGRKKTLSPTPVSQFAKNHNIPLFTPETLNDKSTFNFSLLTFNLIIVADYGLKLPKELIELPKYGALNLHPSLLPAYRGSSPAQWAILQGEKETGVTILTISEEFDQGKILAQKKIPILLTDTQEILYERCFNEGAEMLTQVLPLFLKYRQNIKCKISNAKYQIYLPPKRQEEVSPTPYARKLTKDDGQIDWSKSDTEIERMIRAFAPWPGTYTTLASLVSKMSNIKYQMKNGKGERKVKILKAHLDQNDKLQIDKLQIEGKTPIGWKEFERGHLR